VSVALFLDGWVTLSRILFVLAAGLWAILAVLVTARAARSPGHFRTEVQSVAALSWVAGTAVVGARVALLGWTGVAIALLGAAFVLWTLLLGPVLGSWKTPTVGVSLLLTVAPHRTRRSLDHGRRAGHLDAGRRQHRRRCQGAGHPRARRGSPGGHRRRAVGGERAVAARAAVLRAATPASALRRAPLVDGVSDGHVRGLQLRGGRCSACRGDHPIRAGLGVGCRGGVGSGVGCDDRVGTCPQPDSMRAVVGIG